MTEHDLAHDDDVPLADQMIGNEIDPAGQSLAGALRTSFRLLSVIMVILLIGYILSGLETIDSGDRGAKLRFGRLVGGSPSKPGKVLGEGVCFTWPFPVGEVLVISVQEQQLALDSFWHYERPGEAALLEAEKKPVGEGLRPAYDGSLLTGDQGLVHIKWAITYQVSDQHVLDFVQNVGDHIGSEQGLLRSVIENASVQAAAQYPAEDIVRGSREFTTATKNRAQRMLDDLSTSLRIISLTLAAHTPPLQTLASFRQVTMAESEREQAINGAKKAATGILRDAAGENWGPVHSAILDYERSLAQATQRYEKAEAILKNASGEKWEALRAREAIGDYEGSLDTDAQAIERHERATAMLRDAAGEQWETLKAAIDEHLRSEDQAIKRYEAIVALLHDEQTSGQASKTIADARGEASTTLNMARQEYERYRKLLDSYQKAPELTMSDQWMDALQEIMTNELAVKYYVPAGVKTVLYMKHDPSVWRAIKLEETKRTQEDITYRR
ncbi:MAG: hypothetical protein E4H23_08970 [Chrysiogenales bacterium]|nr:MAG: hypothetical protein E4H23_08970 [Chrysiogenales bacterium]